MGTYLTPKLSFFEVEIGGQKVAPLAGTCVHEGQPTTLSRSIN